MAGEKKGGKRPQNSPRVHAHRLADSAHTLHSARESTKGIKEFILRSKGPSGGKADKK